MFLLACWLPGLRLPAAGPAWRDAFAARARALLLCAAAAGAISGALAVVLQGAAAGGTAVWDALDASVIGDVLETRFGVFWGLGVPAWLLALARPGALMVVMIMCQR